VKMDFIVSYVEPKLVSCHEVLRGRR
jgi:hypothetical protein